MISRGLNRKVRVRKGEKREELYIAYCFSERKGLETMRLLRSPPGMPCGEGLRHRGYEVNLYRLRSLPQLKLQPNIQACAEESAYRIAECWLRDRFRKFDVYVLHTGLGDELLVSDEGTPRQHETGAYEYALTWWTNEGYLNVYLLECDLAYFRYSTKSAHVYAIDKLTSQGAKESAIRYALLSWQSRKIDKVLQSGMHRR